MITIAALIVGMVFPPDVAFDHRLSWLTMETEHFLIHFSTPGELRGERVEFIRRIARTAEGIRLTVLKETGRVPREKVNIVIADFIDDYTGWAVPFPSNTITILTTPPRVFDVSDDDWLRTLLLHEFSHITQMEQIRGLPLFLRRIFGRVVLPNALMPTWLLEGYAVYNESRFSSGGRLRSAQWQGMLLTAAQERELLTIDRCGGYELQRYPGGLAPYLYGAHFFDFLARSKGDSICDKFNWQHSGQVPFFENIGARRVFGKGFPELWNRWQEILIKQAESVKQRQTDFSRTPVTLVVDNEFNIGSPVWSRNGTEIYYVATAGSEKPAIKALNLGTRTVRTIYRGNITGGVSFSPNGMEIAFSEWVVSGNGYIRSDVFLYDLTTGRKRRLTFNNRAYDPDFSPDDSLIVYVSNSSGQSNLVLMNIKTGEKRQLTDNRDSCVYHRPRFSPGGRLIAVGVWRPGGNVDIEIIDRETGWVLSITSDRAGDIFPVWSRTGKFLFFVSDRNGLYNLYAYGVENQLLYRCSDVIGGVFEPAISPDNRRIALICLTGRGKALGVMELKGEEWKIAEGFVERHPYFTPETVPVGYQIYYYYPLATLPPTFWLPWINFWDDSELGVYTLGWDVLQFHRYQAAAGYNFTRRTPFLRMWYEFRRFWPDIELSSEFTAFRQQFRLGASAPFYGNDWFQAVRAGFTTMHKDTWRVKFDCGWEFTNSQRYRFCVAPVSGRELGVSADGETKAVYGASDRIRVTGYWTEYPAVLPRTWSLKLKMAVGRAWGDSLAFRLSNTSGLFRVRGYPDDSPSGSSAGLLEIELRVPFLWVERGPGTAPVFFRNINTAVFCEAGFASQRLNDISSDLRTGVGSELRADFILAHYLPLTLTLGAGLGLKPDFSHQIYFDISSELLEGLVKPSPRLRDVFF